MKVSPERAVDGGVEMIATRVSDGRKLAVEHTLIEPFVGEKTDFHSHFKELGQQLRANDSLQVPRFALYVDAPVNVLPPRVNRQGIIDDVATWLRANRMSFPTEPVLRDCPSPHHPDGKITLRVRLQPLDDQKSKFLIAQRYGEMRIGDAVEKAIQRKVPKLVKTDVHALLLLLERDQAWVDPDAIYDEVERLRPLFPDLAAVHEIWIVDTASFDDKKEYAEFSRRVVGSLVENFAFFRGKLLSISKHGIPVHVDRSALH